MEQQWHDIKSYNKNENKRFVLTFLLLILLAVGIFLLSIFIGRYGAVSLKESWRYIANFFGANYDIDITKLNIIKQIRIPRSLASFLIGGALSIAGLVYQNTFNNKLISPDLLGVSAGCSVGAGIAILLGLSGFFISLFAFFFGFIAVIVSLLLPKLFKNKSNITLVLSGIIVGSFMNSIISLLKYIADKDDKLSEITFWLMGSLSGITMKDVLIVSPIIFICFIVLYIMNWRIDVVSLGKNDATLLGMKYSVNRLVIIVCSTMLTATSVSISGNIGWVGLVIPHISRLIIGNKSKFSIPIGIMIGGCFMMLVDLLARLLSVNEIPISLITGFIGSIIYTIVLTLKGNRLNE